MIRELVLGAAGAALCICAASAHVTLETREAPVGAPYKAVLRVPHGCEGAPTIALRVRIPEGVISVKPMLKPGWKIDTVTGKYSKSYQYFHGAKLSEGVSEIAWSDGKIPDAFYDDSCSRVSSPATSKPARRSISRSCRNARKACIAGSRSRPRERPRRTIRNPPPG
jgi:periplasmic copper chaperone A